jgi:hypothetical protein
MLFNIRLGWWLPNPTQTRVAILKRKEPKQPLLCMIREAFGLTNDTYRYIYLSDGGHFENLGIYEMALRRCKTIVCVDAGCDPNREFEDLGNAIRKIYIDQGIQIEMRGVTLGKQDRNDRVRCAVGDIEYPEFDPATGERRRGTLLYIKPALHDSDPVDVKNFGVHSPEFPHERALRIRASGQRRRGGGAGREPSSAGPKSSTGGRGTGGRMPRGGRRPSRPSMSSGPWRRKRPGPPGKGGGPCGPIGPRSN